MHYSAKRGIEIAYRLSVCNVSGSGSRNVSWKSWKLIARTISPTSSLFVAHRSSTYSQGNMGKFGETRGGVEESGVLDHKSGNISDAHKDRRKVTIEGL